MQKAVLYLEDGTLYEGIGFGGEGESIGEVVFNTSMTGYQEILTDPSYAGQIVIMTQPEIGNMIDKLVHKDSILGLQFRLHAGSFDPHRLDDENHD